MAIIYFFVFLIACYMKSISLTMVTRFVHQNNLELKSTHNRLCYPIIERLYKKMSIGIKFSGIKVDGDVIVDGHHRYLASLLAGIKLDRFPSNRTSATKTSDWKSVDFVEDDWDSEAEVWNWNLIDADYNGMTIDELHKFLQ